MAVNLSFQRRDSVVGTNVNWRVSFARFVSRPQRSGTGDIQNGAETVT